MSPAQARARTLYILIGINVVLLASLVAVTVFKVLPVQQRLERTVATNREGCLRGNVSRDTQRYVLATLADVLTFVQAVSTNEAIRDKFATVTPELQRRANLPAIQHQPCETLYPR